MKTLNQLFHVILISFLMVAVSCSKDEAPKAEQKEIEDTTPELKVIGGIQDFSGVVGSTENGEINFTLETTTPAGYKSLSVYKVVDGEKSLVKTYAVEEATFKYEGTYSVDINYIIEEEDVEKEAYFEAYVLDSENKQSSTVKVANLEAFGKMSYFSLYVGTTLPAANGGVTTPNFLILGTETSDLNMGDMVTNNLSAEIDLVFSVNDGLGYYLTSPAACIEEELMVKFQELNTTKLKAVEMAPEEFDNLNPFKTIEVLDMYEQHEFNSHQQRAEQMDLGKCITFKTVDGQKGIIIVKQFFKDDNADPVITYIKLGIWIYL